MKRCMLLTAGFLMMVLSACGNDTGDAQADVKEQVHSYSVEDHGDIEASITSEELVVTDGDEVTKTSLPEDEFFVSVAPFVEMTHPCAVHSLTGCQGEMTEETFNVKITDESGNTVVDEEMTSFENGFIDLWLPREQTFTVEIEHDGKTSESEISTFEGDDTCITTMQLV